jgi:hypothetical protein
MAMLGNSKAEIELTKKIAQLIVVPEVVAPMSAIGWTHSQPPTPQQLAAAIAAHNASTGGQPAPVEGAPAPAAVVTPAPQSGQPAKQEPVAQPAPAKTDASQPATQNVAALFESLRDANGLIMGKYKDVEAALKGAGHLAQMAKDALGRAESAEADLKALRTAAPASPPAAAPAAVTAKPFVPASRAELNEVQARLDKVLSKASENGVLDVESAREYAQLVREAARVEARVAAEDDRRMAQHTTEVENEKWLAVNEYMKTAYPDSVTFSDEVGLHVRSNPLLRDAVEALVAQGREKRAAELAWIEFDKTRGNLPVANRAEAIKQEVELEAREQVRKEARDAALKDAGIVHGSAGGASAVETPGVTGPSQDEINGLAAAMRREGETPGSRSAEAWRRATITRFLPPELFGPQG